MRILIITIIIMIQFGCMNKQHEDPEVLLAADSTTYSLGEGAFWDAEEGKLLFIDIIGKNLLEYDPETGTKGEHAMPSMIGTVVTEGRDHVLVALEDGVYRYNLSDRNFEFITCPAENDSTQRFNDGKCDPEGRLWVGTMSLVGGKESSHLFCLDNDGKMSVKIDGVTISNGIVWSSDKLRMYYIDTPTRKVMEYKFDPATGSISNPRVAVSVPDSLGAPDGMTIDKNDHLWVCMWGGSAVCKFDPATGKLLHRIMVPAKNVTSCAFGGEDFMDLYITTARVGTSEKELEKYPLSGALFKVRTSEQGLPLPGAILKTF